MLIRFAHPDDLVRYYLRLDAGIDGIRSPALTIQVGSRCRKCGSGPRTIRTSADPRPGRGKVWTECFACGERWDGEDVEVPRSGGGGDWRRACAAQDARIDEHRRLRPIVETKPRRIDRRRWAFARRVHEVYLDPRFNSYPRVVQWGEEHAPRVTWSEGKVRSAIALVREVVRTRAIEAGMMARDEVRVGGVGG